MTDAKKKPSAIILAGLSKPKDEPMVDEVDEGKKSAGEELLAAFEAKDPVALMEALKVAIEMCDEEEQPEEPVV